MVLCPGRVDQHHLGIAAYHAIHVRKHAVVHGFGGGQNGAVGNEFGVVEGLLPRAHLCTVQMKLHASASPMIVQMTASEHACNANELKGMCVSAFLPAGIR